MSSNTEIVTHVSTYSVVTVLNRIGIFFFICHAPYKSGFILGPKIQGGPNCLSAGVGGLVGPSKYSGSMILSSH